MNFNKTARRLAIVAAVAAGFVGASVQAATVGSGWEYFTFGAVGSSGAFTFTTSESALFEITDAFNSGDQFQITIDGVSFGNTSTPTIGDFTSDYSAAFADANFSSGSYLLSAGAHEVDFTTVLSPYGAGGAAYQLVAAPVPEPTSLALMGLGLLAVGAQVRRRAKRG